MRQYKEQSYITLYRDDKLKQLPPLTPQQQKTLFDLHCGVISCVFQTATEIIDQTIPKLKREFKTFKYSKELSDNHWASKKSRLEAKSLLARTIICTVVYVDGETLIGRYVRPKGEKLNQRHYVQAYWNALKPRVMI
jgi:hypothetical protein